MQDYAKCNIYYILLFVDNNKKAPSNKKQKKTTTTTMNTKCASNYYKLDFFTYFNTFAMISLPRRLQLML